MRGGKSPGACGTITGSSWCPTRSMEGLAGASQHWGHGRNRLLVGPPDLTSPQGCLARGPTTPLGSPSPAPPFGPRTHSLAPTPPQSCGWDIPGSPYGGPSCAVPPQRPAQPVVPCSRSAQAAIQSGGRMAALAGSDRGDTVCDRPLLCAFAPGAEPCAVGGTTHRQMQGVGSRGCWPLEK